MDGRKTKVVEVSYVRREFLTVMVVLMFCLSLFCSNARALYSIDHSGYSDVYGLSGSEVQPATGSEFGYVRAIAYKDGSGDYGYNAYGLFTDFCDVTGITIDGDIGSGGFIEARSESYGAYGLYSGLGSINTGALNGQIIATSGWFRAVGLFTESDSSGSITTGDIGGVITASAWGSSAFGLRCDNSEGTIETGDITGTITAVAGGDRAYGFRSYGNIITGDIDGTITATATGENTGEADEAYGLYASGSLTTGEINGKITARAYYDTGDGVIGDYAYGLYPEGDMVIDGNIGSDAEITATAGNSEAAGLYSEGSLTTREINGKITATATYGSDAAGLYSEGDMVIDGNIGNTAEITATAYWSYASGLYSGNLLTTRDINGIITAEATYGSDAYGLYSEGDMDVCNIDRDAVITATSLDGPSTSAGLFSEGSLTTGEIHGEITAEVTEGSYAYGIGADVDLTVGEIGSDAEITAIAGDGFAYGLYSGGEMVIQAINGTISAEVTDGSSAYGVWSDSNLTITDGIGSTAEITATAEYDGAIGVGSRLFTNIGAINGDITATATEGDSAYGIGAGYDLTIASIGSEAEITAYAGGNGAYGLYSDACSIYINGDIDGTISATADGIGGVGSAYGLKADDSINITGAINGEITATMTNGSEAYGLYANSIETGVINGEITAWAGDSDAAGMSAGSILTGAINGTISATANTGSDATGIGAGSLETGDIGSTAVITAWAQTSNAIGLWGGDIYIDGDIVSGAEITAEVNNGPYAYGLYTDGGDIEIDGEIAGTITAKAARWKAVGIYSEYGDIYTGDISGDINATSGGSSAFGLRTDSSESTIETGAISGSITATSWGDRAYGFRSYGSINITGDISGTITAIADDDEAVGLYGEYAITTDAISGTITAEAGDEVAIGLYCPGDVVDTLITGPISGTIHAHAGYDYAYGILSYGPMDVFVDGGEVNAIADEGTNVAAIQSGRIGEGLETQNADDEVEIAAGSTIVGNIDLGIYNEETGDDDLLTLSGDDSDSTTFADDIMNVETINITGGTWIFDTDSVVSNNLNGITVYGGILGGTGWLEDVYVEGGTLAPGNSVGTINIDGDLTFDEDSTFEVEVDEDGNGDLANVTGTAYLDGTIHVTALDWLANHLDYLDSFEVNVIEAAGGLDDTEFASLEGGTAFLLLGIAYGDEDVILTVEQVRDFATYANTDNERSVGEAFNYLDPIVTEDTDEDMRDVIDEILMLPDGAAVNAAYDQMMPQDALGLPDVTRIMMNQFVGGVLDHMDNIRGSKQYAMLSGSQYLLASAEGSLAAPPETDKWMPFAKGFGTWGDRDTEDDIAGYNYDAYGIVAGMDKLISENTLLGFSVGGSRANVDYSQFGTSGDIDSLLVSLYGSYFKDTWHVDLTLGYAHNWYDSRRSVAFDRAAESDHQGNSYSAAVELGNNFGGTDMLLEPVVGVGYTSVQEGSYTEEGAGSLDLKVDSRTLDGMYTKLGLRVGKEFRSQENSDVIWVPKANAFWIHDFADRVKLDSSFVGGGSFTTEGLEPLRDVFNLGAGLNIYFNKDVRLFVDYGWQTAGNFNSNTVQIGAQWSF